MNNLDEAKRNLKTVIERFEGALDILLEAKPAVEPDAKAGGLAIDVSKKISELQAKLDSLESDLKDKNEEIEYLREQNHQLQAKVGKEQEDNFKLLSKNKDAIKKVDNLIIEFTDYIQSHSDASAH